MVDGEKDDIHSWEKDEKEDELMMMMMMDPLLPYHPHLNTQQ